MATRRVSGSGRRIDCGPGPGIAFSRLAARRSRCAASVPLPSAATYPQISFRIGYATQPLSFRLGGASRTIAPILEVSVDALTGLCAITSRKRQPGCVERKKALLQTHLRRFAGGRTRHHAHGVKTLRLMSARTILGKAPHVDALPDAPWLFSDDPILASGQRNGIFLMCVCAQSWNTFHVRDTYRLHLRKARPRRWHRVLSNPTSGALGRS